MRTSSSSAERRRGIAALTAATAAIVMLPAPATAYSSPDEVPDPFQDYTARDYANALWNLETELYIRTHEREERGDCEVMTYTATHPLDSDDQRTYVQVTTEEDTYCTGAEGDDLRAAYEEQDNEDSDFYHGRPYENLREEYFGTWADTTDNGHHSRTEIHARDAENAEFSVSGTYWDHYSGQDVDISETETAGEHMVPVGLTWPEMQHRSREDRVGYYNDHMNLTSTTGENNREKDGYTPDEWMPSNEDAHCAYGLTWIHIATKHDISLYNSDIETLRELMHTCIDEEHDDAETMTTAHSDDLDWPSLAPQGSSDPETRAEAESGDGPREHYSSRDYADALWNLDRSVNIRSEERESRGECDQQTYTVTDPLTDETTAYARAISPENSTCQGEDGDQLREELDEEAAEDSDFYHSSPLAGTSREHFGFWQEGENGLVTRQYVLARDLDELSWNSTETGVVSGDLIDPYNQEEETLAGAGTQIDHMLPVEHAWIELEHREEEERTQFFNDPTNLVAVTEESAEDKDTDGPRNWMPDDDGFHCRYALAWTHTASAYNISLFDSDIEELRETLYSCLSEEITESSDGEAEELEGPRREELDWASLPPY